jgi:hypothetical protein
MLPSLQVQMAALSKKKFAVFLTKNTTLKNKFFFFLNFKMADRAI